MKLKTRLIWLSLAAILCLLMATPASAGTVVYDNGPINGTINAWTISTGSQVSDSFTLGSAATLSGAQIGLWLLPGDSATAVDWSIGTTPFGSDISSGTAALAGTFQYNNALGFDIYESTFSLGGSLAAGTPYYLTLGNLVVSFGDPGYWDENDGPSSAYTNAVGVGQIGSESFQLYTPEPASMVLLGSGMLIFAGFMRKLTS
ncbi:MAG TPA: PEP-CTERM sorting domain-containing protein [Terriglobia bacterium]|nr:PEP-CTERM sorting domain-containing protein [Terriglobia bacterium]